jgi:hypothetical protein
MRTSKNSPALRGHRSTAFSDGEDRSRRLAALTLTFSMAAVLGAGAGEGAGAGAGAGKLVLDE